MASKALAEVFSAVDWRLTGLIGFWVGMPPAVFLCDLHFYFLAAGGVDIAILDDGRRHETTHDRQRAESRKFLAAHAPLIASHHGDLTAPRWGSKVLLFCLQISLA